jgi:hypothetical protein
LNQRHATRVKSSQHYDLRPRSRWFCTTCLSTMLLRRSQSVRRTNNANTNHHTQFIHNGYWCAYVLSSVGCQDHWRRRPHLHIAWDTILDGGAPQIQLVHAALSTGRRRVARCATQNHTLHTHPLMCKLYIFIHTLLVLSQHTILRRRYVCIVWSIFLFHLLHNSMF